MTRQDFGALKQGRSGMQLIEDAEKWWAKHKPDYPGCSWGLPVEERKTTELLSGTQGPGPHDPKRVEKLISLVDNKDKGIRLSAVEALRRLQNPAAIPTMVRLMDDSDSFIQYLGMMTLCEMNNSGGRGYPSTILFQKSPKKYKAQWKDWWKKKQSG